MAQQASVWDQRLAAIKSLAEAAHKEADGLGLDDAGLI